VANLTDLTELVLLNNELETLPKRIGLCCNLAKLELASNRLASLPDTFAALTKLDRIDMESNLLKVHCYRLGGGLARAFL
jgi:Leucine-rich repeat (LRR) protein